MLGKPITQYAASSNLAQCYRHLAEEVASRSHKKWSQRKKSSGLGKKLSSIVARR
jgi:nitrogenase subunit NifH